MPNQGTISLGLDGIGHLISDRLLAVPEHQRSFAWREEEVTDLLNDVESAMQRGEMGYFLGSIVLIPSGVGTQLYLLDGQQRLATVVMVFAATRDYL